jgi:hypothetical protein
MSINGLRELMVLPEVSPYHFPTWAEERFRAVLHQYFDFDELRLLARKRETHEILDRRNALAGNLSMEQELRFIEVINRAIAAGTITNSKYRRISIGRISLDSDLGYRSKMDRRPQLLEELRAFGKTKCRLFLKERESRAPGRH